MVASKGEFVFSKGRADAAEWHSYDLLQSYRAPEVLECSAKVGLLCARDLAGKSWDPETWDRDIWMDTHEVMEEMDSTSTPRLSGFTEVGPLFPSKSPTMLEDVQKLLPNNATGTPTQELLSPRILDARPIITRANSQDKLAGDMLGLIKEERDCIPKEL